MLEFQDDAIVLSGVSGTRIKSQILGEYYPFWWRITSGGDRNENSYPTSLIEMNAGTGEDYIKETGETILGSSGHALKLKAENPKSSRLSVVLVEENPECFEHLKNVIRKRWSRLTISSIDRSDSNADSGVYLLKQDVSGAVDSLERMKLGNSLFFFDPLLYTPWSDIEKVARKRVKYYYRTGTEFIVFLFTSDWFRGRSGVLVPLPEINDPSQWDGEEKKGVSKMDSLFGHSEWQKRVLVSSPEEEKMEILVDLYRKRLHRWFRYVFPMPFEPKANQLYHLFMCSNFEAGVRVTRQFYTIFTGNPEYSPNNESSYKLFLRLHPDKAVGLIGSRRPDEWKILWKVITLHEEGICDLWCEDLHQTQWQTEKRRESLEWLSNQGYLNVIPDFIGSTEPSDIWSMKQTLYQLNWPVVTKRLGIDPPPPLKPLSPSST